MRSAKLIGTDSNGMRQLTIFHITFFPSYIIFYSHICLYTNDPFIFIFSCICIECKMVDKLHGLCCSLCYLKMNFTHKIWIQCRFYLSRSLPFFPLRQEEEVERCGGCRMIKEDKNTVCFHWLAANTFQLNVQCLAQVNKNWLKWLCLLWNYFQLTMIGPF